MVAVKDTGKGKVIIPAGVSVWEHELATAQKLAARGNTVEFLTPSTGNELKIADIVMAGVTWEMKSPESSSVKSLQRILRRAGKQSSNVIIDIARMKGISTNQAETELRRLKPHIKAIKRLLLVTRSEEVIDIF